MNLFEALQANNIDLVRQLLISGADPNSLSETDRPVLCYVCQMGYFELFKLLIEGTEREDGTGRTEGANLNLCDCSGRSPLHLACLYNRSDIVAVLLAYPQVNINKPCNIGCTPLQLAVNNCNLKIIEYLLARPEINLNTETMFGDTPLLTAARNGYLEVVKALIKARPSQAPKCDIDYIDKYGKTALGWACRNEHEEIVKLLINNGANPNLAGDEHNLPLSCVYYNGNMNITKVLKRSGAYSNMFDNLDTSNTMEWYWNMDQLYVAEKIKDYTPSFRTLSLMCIRKYRIKVPPIDLFSP